jgi:DNA helicase IV/mRNA-degrading endonuclease RelE of RelBE toxin-antitoxin system
MCIRATRRFLNALLDLPELVSTKLPEVIESIQSGHRQGSCKIRNGKFCRRRIITYRLFYRYDNGCLDLLDIPRRKEDTYKGVEDLLDELLVEFEYDTQTDSHQECLLSEKQLRRWKIPQVYDKHFIKLRSEEELIALIDQHPEISYKYIAKIIDILPRSLKDVSKETYYEIGNPESLVSFYQTGELNEFLLALSDEQKRIRDLPCDKAILVQGGPGTGKSILAIHRVKKLVEDKKVDKILFTTHNETLVDYFKELLNELVPLELTSGRVEVCTVDDVVRKHLKHDTTTRKLTIANRKISELCLESVLKNIRLKSITQTKLNKLGSVFILEEILKTIESKGISNLEEYIKSSRILQHERNRKEVLEAIYFIYTKWKEVLQASGYTTIEQSRRQAFNVVSRLLDKEKPYDAVIVDEVQDLSPTALRLLIKSVKSTSGLFLTGDAAQSLYERNFRWDFIYKEIGCNPGTPNQLKKSFRNTEQISKACPNILVDINDRTCSNMSQAFPITGDLPKIVLNDDLVSQSKTVIRFFKEANRKWKLPISAGTILVPNELLGLFITNQLNYDDDGLKAKWLNRKISNPEEEDYIRVLSLDAAKGLEFPFVAIIGLEENFLPRSLENFQREEATELENQERRLFYVGCSRAMRSLLVCGSKSKPSKFIKELQDKISRSPNPYWEVE